jgi:CDP-glucose 4,6-dehydratase
MFCDSGEKDLDGRRPKDSGPHETAFLKLDNSLIRSKIGFSPKWNIKKAVSKTIEWTEIWMNGGDIIDCMESQINEYMGENTDD